MQVALAVVGAIVAALLETSVATFATIGGVKPDLVLVSSIAVVVTVGAELGFTWSFVGGLTLDMLSAPARPVGSTVVAILIAVGIAAVVARFLGRNRIAVAVAVTFPLSFVFQLVFAALLSAVVGALPVADPLGATLPIAVANTILAIPVAAVARWTWLRWGSFDRIEW